jgi:hypothetical protein
VTDNNIIELPDRDEQMFQARLSGQSVRSIARQFRVSEAQVQATVARLCTPVNVQMRVHTLQLELERLDQLEAVFYARATNEGDPQSAVICVKIAERRAAYLGIDAPVKVDPVQLAEAAAPKPTSTDRIRAALDRIASQHKPNGDGEEPPQSPPAA